MDSLPPLLVLRLGSSLRLALMLGLAHVAAISLLWPLMLPVAAKLAATAALAISLVIYLRNYALRNSPGSITSLALADDMTLCSCASVHATARCTAASMHRPTANTAACNTGQQLLIASRGATVWVPHDRLGGVPGLAIDQRRPLCLAHNLTLVGT